jgi:tRNA (cytidine/uridine-2'-O-)-methyltransferase
MINIVLLEPEIPQNTGNIARTCTAIGAKLHIIKPIPFDISDKSVRRAGLDYWQYLNLEVHNSLDEFLEKYADNHFFYCTTKTKTLYTNVDYPNDCFLFFGPETRGLPEALMFGKEGENDAKYFPNFTPKKVDGTAITIPMCDNIRSLNLSNAVAIVAYEVVRQRGM